MFADPLLRGSLDEVLIADDAFTTAQITALQTNSPTQFTTNFLTRGSATEALAYSNNLSGTATDLDPGEALTYSQVGGPAWLSVSASGILTGTPSSSDGGTNYLTVRVTDAAGASSFAVVMGTLKFSDTSGTQNWNLISSGGSVLTLDTGSATVRPSWSTTPRPSRLRWRA